jgi:hypothetical protein
MDLLAGLRPADFARAAEKLSALGFAGNSEEMQLLVSAWCTADIHAAAAYALRREVPELIAVVAGDWGGRDYDAAAEWALGIPVLPLGEEFSVGEGGSTVRDYALARIILPTVEQDPGRALATVLRALGPGPKRTDNGNLGQQVTAAIMRRFPGVIDELIKNMPDGPAKELASNMVLERVLFGGNGGEISTVTMSGGSVDDRLEPVASFTPGELAAAAAFVASLPPTGSARGTRPRLFLEYALIDRPTAVSLTESMPAGATRENALAGVAAAIASSEGLKAGLTYLKDSPVETQGLLLDAWATHLASKDPGKVLADAGLIAELPFEKRPIAMAFSNLHRSDPAAADRWLEANPQFAPFIDPR